MKICFLSYSNSGGAGKATIKVINSLKKINIRCDHKYILDNNNFSFVHNLKEKINRNSSRLIKRKINSFKSLSLFKSSIWKELNKSDYDIIHLTWINELLSIEDIGKIEKPIVWTLCDMWPFTGVNHYDDYGKSAFWRKKNFNKFSKKNFNLDTWLVKRKINSWKNLNIVAPSKWLYDCARDSIVMNKFNINLIPWPVDKNCFKKFDKKKLRKKYKLPLNKKLVLYNAFNGIKDRRKGWDYLVKAIDEIKEEFEILIIGEDKIKNFKLHNKKIFSLGKFNNDKKIAEILNCADLIVIPSKVDNLPQVGIEAQSCGLPVVTFNCNGLKDLVIHKKDGFLAKPYDHISLANGIDWTLKYSLKKNLSKNAIIKVNKIWNSKIISKKYKNLYDRILKN